MLESKSNWRLVWDDGDPDVSILDSEGKLIAKVPVGPNAERISLMLVNAEEMAYLLLESGSLQGKDWAERRDQLLRDMRIELAHR